MRSSRWRCGAVVAVLALAACDSGPAGTPAADGTAKPAATTAARVVHVASLTPGQAIAEPAGTVLFTVTGKITVTNQGSALALDRSTLDRLSVVQAEMYEPWTKSRTTFRGVWLKDLVEVARAAADATTLHIVAHDDYAVDIPLSDVRAGGILLATGIRDGSAIPLDEGGPTRIVFLDGVQAGANPDQWVWSIKEIAVR
jgi:hypothetical protein